MGNLEQGYRIRGKAETAAFNTEYNLVFTDEEIKQDIISYLLEYRLNTQKFSYKLEYSNGEFRDVHRKESMATKGRLAILEKRFHSLPTRREEAELRGILNIENQLKDAKEGDLLVWASPPGPKEEGYGNYGFIYTGEIKQQKEQLDINMTAFRIENPSIGQFNKALSGLAMEDINFENAEQFLETPKIIKNEVVVDKILADVFLFREDLKKTAKDKAVIMQIDQLVNQYVEILKLGKREEKTKFLHVLENYVVELSKEDLEEQMIIFQERKDIRRMLPEYGHKPKDVAGSCGASSVNSSNLFKGDSLNLLQDSDEYGSLTFSCPNCGQKNVRPKGELIKNCQHCNSGEVGCE